MHHSSPVDNNDLRPEITDLQAIDEVNRGNREMFEVLVRRHNRLLFRVGLSYLRQHQQTEDAMQNTYLKAFVHLGNFQRNASFSTWITRIMINECLMTLRRNRNAREESLPEENVFQEVSPAQGAANLNFKDMKVLLEKAINTLPRNLRTVFILREVQNVTTAEAAAILGVSHGSIKVSLHRARDRLKAKLLESAAGVELFQYRAEHCNPLTVKIMSAILRCG